MLRMGQFAEALQHMNEVIALRLAVLPADHNQVGESYTNRARIHFAQGGVEQALADARRALAISEAQYPGDHWSLVQDYEKLAQYLVADNDLTAAAEIADKGVAMAQRLHQRTPNPEVVDVALHARIVVLRAQGFYPQALALARQVVQSRATRIAPSNTNLLDTRALLADLLRLSGEAEQAQTELMLAVDGWRQRPASHAPQLVATMGLFATAGYCDWLQTTWPEQMAAPMAAALAHGRQTCHMSGAAFGSE
jgi:tetratricopeptide (TPR) repeat protein